MIEVTEAKEEVRSDDNVEEVKEKVTIIQHYNDLRLRRLYHYIMYTVTEEEGIKEHPSDMCAPTEMTDEKSYEKFLNALPDDDCRYAVFDYKHMSKEDSVLSKIVFIIW